MPSIARQSMAIEDPFSHVLRPPPGESNLQKSERLKRETEAKKISDDIDKRLKEDNARRKREALGEHKILLLGQASAGKTTIVKQMRLLYDPQAHERDRLSWKTVVQLNVITAIRTLVEAIEQFDRDDQSSATSSQAQASQSNGSRAGHSSLILSPTAQPTSPSSISSGPSNRALLARLRVAPLLSLEPILRKRLGAVGEEEDLSGKGVTSPSWQNNGTSHSSFRSGNPTLLLKAGWQDRLFNRNSNLQNQPYLSTIDDSASIAESTHSGVSGLVANQPLSSQNQNQSSSKRNILGRKRSSSAIGKQKDLNLASAPPPDLSNVVTFSKDEDPTQILAASKEDLIQLWNDPLTKKLRKKGKLDSTDSAAYFLDNIERISDLNFTPTDEDIMNARVRTVGITEERFQISKSVFYRICDVGGSRSQRSVWAPYFDDAQAIIFLAPISAFDQRLLEDPRVNRVDDSLELFSQIVENPLLSQVSLVLFLNKIDVLERKLRSGISVSKYFPEYQGANDFEEVWRWFRSRFRKIVTSSRSVAPQRPVYVHTTVATSTRQIKAILMSVNDTILRNNLRMTGLTFD